MGAETPLMRRCAQIAQMVWHTTHSNASATVWSIGFGLVHPPSTGGETLKTKGLIYSGHQESQESHRRQLVDYEYGTEYAFTSIYRGSLADLSCEEEHK
jgi:hypothetical protein